MEHQENINFQSPPSPPEELVPPHLWSLTNIFCAAVLAASFVYMGWVQLFHSRLDQVAWPEHGLPLIVGRGMELKESLKKIPTWERVLYRAMLVDSPNDLKLAIRWYEELAAYSSEPHIPVQLAILEGEAGRLEKVRQRISEWRLREEPYPLYARLINVAYFNAPEISPPVKDHEWELVWQIGEGWFRDRFMARLADRTSNRMPRSFSRELFSRSTSTLALVRLFVTIELSITVAGIIALAFLLFQSLSRPATPNIGTASIPPCWGGVAGTIVLIRVVAIFNLLNFGAGVVERFVGLSIPLLWPTVSLISIVMSLAMARRYLLKPLGLEIEQSFGLSLPKAGYGQLLLWVTALLAATFLGDWGIMWISERMGFSFHWTESFDSDFVWGTPSSVGLAGVNVVALGPIFEELVFRGLLFVALRRKFSLCSAAVLSAVVFSTVHGYSIAGFLSIAWTGMLLAWAYEKTKSLWPGIIAHGIQNLLWSLSLIVFLRS